jgi:hypothetical protein
MGMASDQQIAAAEGVLFGAGLANNAQDAADLASAGTILSNVFKSAGASQELFVRLLSSGSPVLYNNFGLTTQMVQAKQAEIEATSNLSGEEAKSQALKEILIDQANKYKGALSEQSIAQAQAQAAQQNFSASFGNLINALDQTTGATDFLTKSLNRMTEGAKSWSWVATTTSDLLAQNRAIVESSEAYQDYQISIGATTQAEIDAASAAKTWVSSTEAMGMATQDTASAVEATLSSIGPLNSSLDAMGFSAAGALEAVDPLTRGLIEQSNAAREAAQASQEFAAAKRAEIAAAGGPATNREADAYRQMAQARTGMVDTAGQYAIDENQRRIAEQNRQEEQAAQESERRATQQAQVITKSFDQVGQQISSSIGNAVSGAIGELAEVWNPGGQQDAANGAAQWARRMAAIAAGGIKDEWANPERWANFGGDKSMLQPLFDAIAGGDDAGVKVQAQQLLANKTADLFDANIIAQQVETKLRAQRLQQALNDRVSKLLGERGLQAVTNVTQQVGQAVGVTDQAAQQVGTNLAGVGASAETTGAQVGAAFDGAIGKLTTVNQLISQAIGLTERWGEVTQSAVDKFNNVGPGAATAPSDAERKQGPPSPL